MFQCIACTKQTGKEKDEEARESGTPNRKEAVKSLTAQVKDMALKFSGAFKGSSTDNKGQKPNPDRDNTEGVPYPYMGGGTSGLTPAWDFRSSNVPGDRSDPRFIGGTSGDKTPSGHISAVPRGALLEEDVDDREWVAQVEPGVHISFVSLSEGGNDLKRIRFSMDVFDKVQAQKWWVENFDRIKELYNVQRINQQALNTPARSDDEQRDSIFSRQLSVRDSPVAAWLSNDITLRNQARPFGQGSGQHMHAGSSSNEPSLSNASDIETEWIEQDQPGVFVTVKQLPDGTKDVRRVKFSRQRFDEVTAKRWWDDNKERIQAEYM